jgi:class 3 adenylate cyclase
MSRNDREFSELLEVLFRNDGIAALWSSFNAALIRFKQAAALAADSELKLCTIRMCRELIQLINGHPPSATGDLSRLIETLHQVDAELRDREDKLIKKSQEFRAEFNLLKTSPCPFPELLPVILEINKWPLPTQGSVVSADLVGSERYVKNLTTIVGDCAHTQMREEVQRLYDMACHAAGAVPADHREGGEGDSGTFVFRDPKTACLFAINIHLEAEKLNLGRSNEFKLWFGVAVASGKLHPSQPGAGKSPWSGDPLIVASRLRSHAGIPGSVVVDKETHCILPDDYKANLHFKERRLVERKGGQESILPYEMVICSQHPFEAEDANRWKKPNPPTTS